MEVAISAAADRITASLEESIRVKRSVLETMVPEICRAAEWIIESLKSGHKILLAGNGGSAADAQHVAAEFVGRFERERRAWPAICLSTDTSVLTAIGNDYSVDLIFARQIEALGAPRDVFLAYSTSGNSPNIVRAARTARERSIRVIGFCGEAGGDLARSADLALCVPSRRTARVQESHITISHAICEVVEGELARLD